MSVIIYAEYCETLEEENLLLKKEVRFLRKQLESKVKPYYFTQVVANRVMEMTDFLAQIPDLAYRDNTQLG